MTGSVADLRGLLIKEVAYRASYRGTLELDLMCRKIVPHLHELSDDELAAVRDLLLNSESDLMDWLVDGGRIPSQWQPAVALLRRFKGAPMVQA